MGRTVTAMIKRLRAEQAKIAKNRDTLRDLISEFETIADDTDEAIQSIEYAVDALSRLQ